jgi:hypothetical protein
MEREDIWKVMVQLANVIVDVSAGADRRANTGAVCSLCHTTSTPLVPVSRGHICSTCYAVMNFGLIKDLRRLQTENDQVRVLLNDCAGAVTSVREVAEFIRSMSARLDAKTAENEALKQAVQNAEGELLAITQTCVELRTQVDASERGAEVLRRELAAQGEVAARAVAEAESLRRELGARTEMAASAAADLLAVPWTMEYKSVLHPKIFQHILDLLAVTTSPSMAKAIEEFLKGLLRAIAKGRTSLEGSSQEVIDTLEKSGFMQPVSYSGRVLSWLVRHTPLVTRQVRTPIVYHVHLDWFTKPTQDCLEHHQLRRRCGP